MTATTITIPEFKIYGCVGALLEVAMFFIIAYYMHIYKPFMPNVMYYWFTFTVLTGLWECVYLTHFYKIRKYADSLAKTGSSVWTDMYPLDMVLPNKFAKLFYAEYGAHADREYMSYICSDYWSRLVESSHLLFCAVFCFFSLIISQQHISDIVAAAGMGAQFMNSLLYMGEYFRQCADKTSVNYVTKSFPLSARWFMWINLLWLVMPVWCLYLLL